MYPQKGQVEAVLSVTSGEVLEEGWHLFYQASDGNFWFLDTLNGLFTFTMKIFAYLLKLNTKPFISWNYIVSINAFKKIKYEVWKDVLQHTYIKICEKLNSIAKSVAQKIYKTSLISKGP